MPVSSDLQLPLRRPDAATLARVRHEHLALLLALLVAHPLDELDVENAVVHLRKWIRHGDDDAMLFDLANDIGGATDLAGERPEKEAELRAAFRDWKARIDAAEPPREPFRDF